jgi:hypothetical protein
MVGKGKGGSGVSKTPAKLGGSKNIPKTKTEVESLLERYSALGAQYVRRTVIAGGITVLLEIGHVANGKVEFIALTDAEVLLAKTKSKREISPTARVLGTKPAAAPASPESKPAAKSAPRVVSDKPVSPKAKQAPKQPTTSKTGKVMWGDLEDPMLSSDWATKPSGVPSPIPESAKPQVLPSPKVQKKKSSKMNKPVARPTANLAKRALSRLGMSLDQVVAHKNSKSFEVILDLSQKDYRVLCDTRFSGNQASKDLDLAHESVMELADQKSVKASETVSEGEE